MLLRLIWWRLSFLYFSYKTILTSYGFLMDFWNFPSFNVQQPAPKYSIFKIIAFNLIYRVVINVVSFQQRTFFSGLLGKLQILFIKTTFSSTGTFGNFLLWTFGSWEDSDAQSIESLYSTKFNQRTLLNIFLFLSYGVL